MQRSNNVYILSSIVDISVSGGVFESSLFISHSFSMDNQNFLQEDKFSFYFQLLYYVLPVSGCKSASNNSYTDTFSLMIMESSSFA